MAKRPTPKQRHPRSRGRARHEAFRRKEWKRLRDRAQSPYILPARKADEEREEVTTIQA